MRNLKKLFAVLLAVAMIASMMVPALAAVDYQDEALKLQAIKVFAGGPDDLKLEEGVSRAQGLAFAIRVAGKEAEVQAMADADVDAILADWVDASELTGGAAWARKYVAYAVKTEMTLGVGGKKLAALENITGTSLMVFVLKAMGYSEATTANIAELVVDKGVMSAGDAAKFAAIQSGLVRDDAAGILFNAFANGVNKDGTKLIDAYIASGATTEAAAAEAGFVEVLDAITVAAVGAKKLEVKFNKAVDSTKATIEVKRGTVKPSVKEVKWAEDKKSAVIEFSNDMAAGDYTVTVSGLTETALTATTKVEAAKLTTINFKSDLAIISGNNVTVSVVAENQYGEDMTSKISTSNTSLTASKGTTPITLVDGMITVPGAAGDFKVDEKVVITLVHSTIVASKTLTIAKAAAIESIEFGELTTDEDDLKGKVINVSRIGPDYYLPITVKDQYGNTLTKKELNDAIAADTFKLISSNTKVIKLGAIDSNDNGTFIEIDDADATATNGTVVITAVASATGKTANVTLEVKADAKIDVVNLSAPEAELKQGVAAVLPLEIIDSYGDEVKLGKDAAVVISGSDDDVLTIDTNTTLRVSGAEFSKVVDHVKDTTTIKITPTAKTIVITVTSATSKYQNLTLVANDAPVVTSIKGLDKDFAAMMANDDTLDTDLDDNIIFLDQYGDEIDAPAFATTASAPGEFTVEDGDGVLLSSLVIASSNDAGTAKYVVRLFDADGEELDSFEFSITIVDKTKITSFGVEDLNKFYTGPADGTGEPVAADYEQDITVYGLVNGKKVKINQDMVKHVSGLDGVAIVSDEVVYEQAETETDGKDKEGTLTFLVDNGKATYTITKAIVYSDAAPKAQSVVFYNDGDEVKGDVTSSDDYAVNITAVAKDQYGVELPAITVANMVKTNETIESVQLNVFIDGLYKSLKVIIE